MQNPSDLLSLTTSTEGERANQNTGRMRLFDVDAASSFMIRLGPLLYGLIIGLFGVLFLVAAMLLTLEADESWTLMSTMHAFGVPLPRTSALANPTITSGGFHLLIQGVLSRFTQEVFTHRAVSQLFSVLLISVVYRLLRSFRHAPVVASAGAALFSAVPGFIFQAAMATAEVIATTLLVCGCLHWTRRGMLSSRGALGTGLILGVACATRVNCVAALPAIVAFAACSSENRWRHILRAVLSVIVAGAIVLGGDTLYLVAFHAGPLHEQHVYFTQATGVGAGLKPLSGLVQYVVIANGFLPVYLIAASVGAQIAWAATPVERDAKRAAGVLLTIGMTVWIAWVCTAPIPHIRYIWPAVACIWLCGIIQILGLLRRLNSPRMYLALHGVIIAACCFQLLSGALIIANGESLVLVYQENRLSPFTVPDERFRAKRDQVALAAFVAAQSKSARFFGLAPAVDYPITYLAHRTIDDVIEMPASGERFVVLVPANFAIWRPRSDFSRWRAKNTQVVFSARGFVALRVRDGARAPSPGTVKIGQNDLL